MSIKNMTKEELELLSYKDITNIILAEGKAQSTPDLFKKIVKLLELSDSFYESKIGDYYMMLTTDKRFILLEDGKWDLSTRHTSDKVVVIEDEDEDDQELDESATKKDDMDDESEDYDIDQEEDFDDDGDDDLKDLVILDEDELDLDEQ